MTTGARNGDRPKVLVVEDELIVAADIEASLNYLGYDVLGIAETGKQAVRFAEQQSPDLVLMDIHLPGAVDGIAAADEIRRRLNIPVVFLTALVNEDTISRAKTAQPFGYLTKPFRPNELNATLTIALHRRELARDQFGSDRGQGQEEESETVSESPYCLRELVAHLLTAQEQEWNRISSELHDDVGQRIAVMELSTATLLQLFKGVPADVGGVINNLCADVRWIGHSIGRMSRQLYPAIIQHLGLGPAVLSAVEEYRKMGGDLELSMPALPPVPVDVALVVFRILQQVLRARGRSANGSPVKVTLTVKKQELWLAIENAGFANWDVMSAKERVEWTVMQERARMVRGTFRLAPLTDGGSRIDLRVPVSG